MQPTRTLSLFFIVCVAVGLGAGVILARTGATGSEQPASAVIRDDVGDRPRIVDQSEGDKPANPPQEAESGIQGTGTTTNEPAGTKATDTKQDAGTDKKPAAQKPVLSCPTPSDPNQPDLWLEPVSKDDSLGDDYVPDHLVLLSKYVPVSKASMCLNASAAVRLAAMFGAMHALKMKPVVSSGYRDADYQSTLKTASDDQHPDAACPSVALPGHSEHQLGLAVDIVAGPDYTLDGFENSPEYAWLQDRSWEYGFIQSYPKGKESITGYVAESWHYRYVGLANAKSIHDQGITTFEYLTKLKADAEAKKADTANPPAPEKAPS